MFDLDYLFEQHFFSRLDYFFARSMAKAFNEKDPIVLTSCALVSKALFEGHVCLEIMAMSGAVAPISETGNEEVLFPDSDTWITALQRSSMVSDTIQTPLVLDTGHRLYFSKYFDFQIRLTQNIAQRVSLNSSDMDESTVDEMLESYFPGNGIQIKHQKNAVKHAVLNRFTLISGGPGTGKTFVATVITRMFVAYAKQHGRPEPKIICAAPTGKAASKMEQGSTIHSLLRPLKDRPGFYYHKDNPLQTDMVIIDEASMIDISLLTRLLDAIPMSAKVIIIGDKFQLSSIQAGAVFSDICNVKELFSHIFFLAYNFRSQGKTGIEKLSKAVNDNDSQLLEDILISGRYPDVVFKSLNNKISVDRLIHKFILEGYTPFLAMETVDAALNKLDAFKILCAHNSGEYGTLQINHLCEKILRSENNFDIQEKHFNRVIMVNSNDYKKGLFNGDTGIASERDGEVSAFFKRLDNTVAHYRYSDLPSHDTAYAITIHKSQGAEFNSILLILPDRVSPVVTRQLLYTGITRAREKVTLVGRLEIIKDALNLNIKRNSGISDDLKRALNKIRLNKNGSR